MQERLNCGRSEDKRDAFQPREAGRHVTEEEASPMDLKAKADPGCSDIAQSRLRKQEERFSKTQIQNNVSPSMSSGSIFTKPPENDHP